MCLDFGSGYTEALATSTCGDTGTFSSASTCPSSGRIGRCTTTEEGLTLITSYYSPFTTETVQSGCSGVHGSYTVSNVGVDF